MVLIIRKLNNRSKNFYVYLGKLFGSRVVEEVTLDRIYDDADKKWYVYFDRDHPCAFVSMKGYKIKNVYAEKKQYLVPLLKEVINDEVIIPSVVTKTFESEYRAAGFKTKERSVNFVEIEVLQMKGKT